MPWLLWTENNAGTGQATIQTEVVFPEQLPLLREAMRAAADQMVPEFLRQLDEGRVGFVQLVVSLHETLPSKIWSQREQPALDQLTTELQRDGRPFGSSSPVRGTRRRKPQK